MMLFSLVLLLPAAALATAADGQEPVVLKPQLCSFADEATGFYASWHTNCSGLVTFVLNVHNFPHPQQPLLPDTPAPLVPFGHFWFGIGFRLITTQMALVESWPDGFITVCPARVEQGRAPQRELGAGGGVVLGAKGAFFGDTLAVTFAVDESVLAGCKELVFFSAPTPVGRPYGGVPVTRMACDLARTCNRFSSCAGGGGNATAKERDNSPKSAKLTELTRIRRQSTSAFGDFTARYGPSLSGTAYEGQAQPFQRELPMPVVNTRYAALADWQARKGWVQSEQGTVAGGTAMYWPYRTETAANIIGQGGQQAGAAQTLFMDASSAVANFYDPSKCDGGVDPQWCASHVRQFVDWFDQYGGARSGKSLCTALMDSLRNSDHRCCNALQQRGC